MAPTRAVSMAMITLIMMLQLMFFMAFGSFFHATASKLMQRTDYRLNSSTVNAPHTPTDTKK
jgi:Flp pilus assembly protein TadG